VRLFAIPALLLFAAGCTSAGAPGGDGQAEVEAGQDAADCLACGVVPDASVATLVQSELQRTCTGVAGESYCHMLGAGGMFLSAGDDFLQIVDVPSTEAPSMVRVRPGSPAQSYLYLKLVGDGGIEGGRMPLGAPYNGALVELFYDWIEAGAPDH
jgi:hypothetical protein